MKTSNAFAPAGEPCPQCGPGGSRRRAAGLAPEDICSICVNTFMKNHGYTVRWITKKGARRGQENLAHFESMKGARTRMEQLARGGFQRDVLIGVPRRKKRSKT